MNPKPSSRSSQLFRIDPGRPSALLRAAAVLAAAVLGGWSAARAEPDPRFTAALEAATIRQTTLASVTENSLLIGNGDLNALLYSGSSGLKLRLTKNDVWDARIDTSGDPALAVINIPGHTMTGGTGSPSSWNQSFPCPLTCAVLDLSSAASQTWQQIRAEGTVNTWAYANNLATMALQGGAGSSCGWQTPVTTGRIYSSVRVRLSGTANAKHYIEVLKSGGGSYGSGWQVTPTTEQDYGFTLPAATGVSGIILYAWTNDGALAQNRYAAVELQGTGGNDSLDLSRVNPVAADNQLDLRRAVATVPGNTAATAVAVRALADRNVFLIEGDTTVTLNPTTATFVPAATRGTQGGVEYLVQTLPADPGYPATGDWPGMSFVVAKAVQGQRTAVAIVTSLESATPQADAIALASATAAADANTLRQTHESQWEQFWAASRVDLGDPYLRDVWYRNLYGMRCVSKAGVKPAGLFAGLVGDSAAWHGDYHLNYNAEQTFWGWYGCNHAELSEPYEWLIRENLSRAQWFANLTYGCNGAFFPHSVFLYEPANPASCKSKNGRQVAFIPYTYTLGDAGWAVQNLWLHYQHFPDATLLETQVYPAIKQVAIFYADFADRCNLNPGTGKIVFGPTYSPEHWNWGRDDGTCDIAFARMTLKAASASATRLGVDAALVTRWQQTLAKLPDYPRTTGASPVIVDVAGASPTTYNVPVPALPVYPAGEIHWFSPAADRQIFANTIGGLSSNGNNDLIILAGARARLSMADAYSWMRAQFQARQRSNGLLKIAPGNAGFNDFGHYTEDFAATAVINELLLQSVNDILRFFPAWPADKDAAFENLRAQGGFLVSATFEDGATAACAIRATVGGRLRFLNPWPAAPVARVNGTITALTNEGGGVFALDTAANDEITLTPVTTGCHWDADPATAGAQDGSGTWSTTAATWWNGSDNIAWDNALTGAARIGAGNGPAGTLNVSGSINLNRLTLQSAGSGTYLISGGTLDFGGAMPVIATHADAAILSAITGTAGLTKSGSATLTLSGAVNHTGGTAVTDGTLALTGNLGGGTYPGVIAIGADAAVFRCAGATNLTLSGSVSGSGTLAKDGPATLNLTALNSWTGPLAIDGGTLILSNIGATTIYPYTGGPISINGPATLRITAPSDGHRYDFLGKSFTFGTLGGGTIDTPSGNLVLALTSGVTTTFATTGGARCQITGVRGFNLGASPTVTTVFQIARGTDSASDLTVSAPLWNGASVQKTGDGILTLAGSNTYTGPTTVTAGTLRVTGSLANTALTVATTGKLGGTGTLAGPVTILGTLAPGTTGTGTLTLTNGLTLHNTATVAYDLGTPGTSDKAAVTGNLTLAGKLDLTGLSGFAVGTYLLFSHSGTLTNNGLTVRTLPGPGYTCSLNTATTGQVRLTVGLSPFGTWQTSRFGSPANPAAAPAADPDADGLDNAVEFVLGSEPNPANPDSGSSALAPVSATAPDGSLKFTYRRRDLALTQPGIVIATQYGTDLTGWTDAVPAPNGVTIVIADDAYGPGTDQVTVSIPKALAADDRLFVRLKVVLPTSI